MGGGAGGRPEAEECPEEQDTPTNPPARCLWVPHPCYSFATACNPPVTLGVVSTGWQVHGALGGLLGPLWGPMSAWGAAIGQLVGAPDSASKGLTQGSGGEVGGAGWALPGGAPSRHCWVVPRTSA